MITDSESLPICPVCESNKTRYQTKNELSDQKCWKCGACGFHFIWPHEPWIPSISDSDGDPETFTFWADKNTETVYKRWRNEENQRIASIILAGGNLGRTLEIGFGEGPLTERLIERCTEYWGIEPIPASVERTAQRLLLQRERVFAVTAEQMMEKTELANMSGAFDTIILVSVLEHIGQLRKVLSNCFTLLRPGGRLVISTPDSSYFSILTRIRRCLKMEPWTRYHISFFTPNCLKQLFNTLGFQVASQHRYRLITTNSADYFALLYHAPVIKWIMLTVRWLRIDLILRITTLFLVLYKPSK